MTAPRKPKLTRDALDAAMRPPNTCQVARFREVLDSESLALFDEAMKYNKSDLSARQLRGWLIDVGFDEAVVPSEDHIMAHRATRRPCRCRS